MRSSIGRRAAAVAAVVTVSVSAAACTSAGQPSTSPSGPAPTAAAAAPQQLQPSTLVVPDALKSEFDPHQVLIPAGWSMSVWAAVPDARLAAWTPDGALLVSRPGEGEVVRLAPSGATATSTVLLQGLTQPHGLAFDGGTLYVAESNRIQSYNYAEGAATGPRLVVDGLPDSKSSLLGGQYAHALKSVAVGPDHALYFSIGSSDNISAEDRDATPERASIMRIPPGGGPPEVFARGVRNGTGLAVAPDGAIWTAVNNRDNIRSEEHTSELQSHVNLVCRLLLEKKKY